MSTWPQCRDCCAPRARTRAIASAATRTFLNWRGPWPCAPKPWRPYEAKGEGPRLRGSTSAVRPWRPTPRLFDPRSSFGGSGMKSARVVYEGVVRSACERDGQLLLDGERLVAFDAVTWLPPLNPPAQPRTILALGLNYADHARELAFKAPDEPLVFLKGENALT